MARIFYVMYDSNKPSGGEKDSYQHVDILNRSGFEAFALHNLSNVKLTWFKNETKVIDSRGFWSLYDASTDYLVIPEPMGRMISSFPGKKVIFNKNLYFGFAALGPRRVADNPYLAADVVAAFSVSIHNFDHLKFAFPNLRLFRMYCHIDCSVFKFRPLKDKRKTIACVAKAMTHTLAVFHSLMARAAVGLNRLDEFEWVFLTGYSEEQISAILQDSFICLMLSTTEGLPRSVLEAMACGCITIVYGSGPLKELSSGTIQIEHDNVMQVVAVIENMTSGIATQDADLQFLTERAQTIAERYSQTQQTDALMTAWHEILQH